MAVNQVNYSTAAILMDPVREPLSVSDASPRMGLLGPTAAVNQVNNPTALIRPEGPDELMPWCGVRRPSVRPSTVFKMLLLRHFSTDFDSDSFI